MARLLARLLARLSVISVILARLLAIVARLMLALLPIFRTFSGGILSHSRVVFILVYMATCFFSGDVLWRNHLINRVELFEEKSILVFPECLEASEW